LGPWPGEAARLRPIPESRRRSRPGKRWGSTRCSPRVDRWLELGRRGCPRGGSTAAGGGCCGSSGSRRGGRGLGQHVTPGGVLGSREARGVVVRRRARAGTRAQGGGGNGGRGGGDGSSAGVRGSGQPLNRCSRMTVRWRARERAALK
jgi:hypothetical protein